MSQADQQLAPNTENNASNEPPIRSYLDQTIVPVMLEGLAAVARERPERPVEFLADFLEQNNTER